MVTGLGPPKNGKGTEALSSAGKTNQDVAVAKAALFSGLEEAQSRILTMMNIAAPKANEVLAASESSSAAAAADSVASADDTADAEEPASSAAAAEEEEAASPGPLMPKESMLKASPPAAPATVAPKSGHEPWQPRHEQEDEEQPPATANKLLKGLQPWKAGGPLSGSIAARGLGFVGPRIASKVPATQEGKAFTKAKFPFSPITSRQAQSESMSNFASLMAAAQEEETKKQSQPPPKAPSRPLSGYARASMMNRLAEASDPTDVEAIARNMIRQGEANTVSAEGDKPAGDEPSLRIYLGNVPHGTGEGLIRAECKKYGEINSMVSKTEPGLDSFQLGWAIVSYAAPEMATAAVQRMSKKRTLFGSSDPVEVRFATLQDLREHGLLIEEPAEQAPEAVQPAEAEASKVEMPEQAEAADQGKSAETGNSVETADADKATAPEGAGEDKAEERGKADRSRSRSCATRPAATADDKDDAELRLSSNNEPRALSAANDRGRRSGAEAGSQRERRRGAESDRGRGDRVGAEHDGSERDRGRVSGRGDRGGGAHHGKGRTRGRERDDDEFSWSPRDEGALAARRMAGEFREEPGGEDAGYGGRRREDRYERSRRHQEDYRQSRYEEQRYSRHERNPRYEEDFDDRYADRDGGQHKRCDDRYGGQRKRRRGDHEYDRAGPDDYYDDGRRQDGGRDAYGAGSSGGGSSGRRARVELEPARPRRWSRDDYGKHGGSERHEDGYDCDDFDSRDDLDSRDDPHDGHDERDVRGGRALRDTRNNGRSARDARGGRNEDARGGRNEDARGGRNVRNVNHRRP